MIKIKAAVTAVITTMILSSFIHYDDSLGIAFKFTQFEMIGGVIGLFMIVLSREKKLSP